MLTEIHNADAAQIELTEAILIYSGRQNQKTTTYATVHNVTVQPDRPPVIEAGRPLDLNSLRRFAKEMVTSLRVGTGLLPEGVLSIGLEYVVWWSPASRRVHHFDCPQFDDRVSVGKRSGLAPTCDLIFVATGSSLSLFAFKGDGKTRPTLDTPLMFAPYMNVYASGALCLGSMPIPKGSLTDTVPAWESAFWGSAFTHPNNHSAVSYRGGMHQLFADLLDGKHKTFPKRALKPMTNVTLGSLLKALDEGKRPS